MEMVGACNVLVEVVMVMVMEEVVNILYMEAEMVGVVNRLVVEVENRQELVVGVAISRDR
jgi:hypothetical protein